MSKWLKWLSGGIDIYFYTYRKRENYNKNCYVRGLLHQNFYILTGWFFKWESHVRYWKLQNNKKKPWYYHLPHRYSHFNKVSKLPKLFFGIFCIIFLSPVTFFLIKVQTKARCHSPRLGLNFFKNSSSCRSKLHNMVKSSLKPVI